jgi:hypothetical protein
MVTCRLQQIRTIERKLTSLPGMSDVLGPGEFGRALHEFLDASLRLAPDEEPELRHRHSLEAGGNGVCGSRGHRRDRRHEAIPAPPHRLHILRRLRRVAQGPAQFADAHCEGRVTHVCRGPHCRKQVLFGD